MSWIIPGNNGGVVVKAGDHFHRLPVVFAHVGTQHVLGPPVAVAAAEEGVSLEAPDPPVSLLAVDSRVVARHVPALLPADLTPTTDNSYTVTTRCGPH